jgi:hypothetical protein
VQQHEEVLTERVPLVTAGPESGPLSQGIDGAGVAATNRRVDLEVDFDDPLRAVFPGE